MITVRFYGCCGKVGLRAQFAFAWFLTHKRGLVKSLNVHLCNDHC